MKTKLILALLALSLTTVFAAPPAGWTEDYAKAVEQAKAQKKNLLLDFTGSDWCGFCIKLDKEVFDTPKFKAFAKDNLVLVKVDFPHSKPQSPKVKKQNGELKEKFPFNGYPTVVILDPEGKELGRQGGYAPGSGPEAYIQKLSGFLKK